MYRAAGVASVNVSGMHASCIVARLPAGDCACSPLATAVRCRSIGSSPGAHACADALPTQVNTTHAMTKYTELHLSCNPTLTCCLRTIQKKKTDCVEDLVFSVVWDGCVMERHYDDDIVWCRNSLERRSSAGGTTLPPLPPSSTGGHPNPGGLPHASTFPHLPLSVSPRGPRTGTPGGGGPANANGHMKSNLYPPTTASAMLPRGARTPRSARGADRGVGSPLTLPDWGDDSPAFAGIRTERPDSLAGSPPYTPTGPPHHKQHRSRILSRFSAGAKGGRDRGPPGPLRGVRWLRGCILWALPWMRQCAPCLCIFLMHTRNAEEHPV